MSRFAPKDPLRHIILGQQRVKEKELANQIGLNMSAGFGIVRHIIDLCLAQPEGKYLLLRAPDVVSA